MVSTAQPTRPHRRGSRWSEPVVGLGTASTAIFTTGLLLWARGVRHRLIAEEGLYVSQDALWYFDRADAFARGDWLWHGVTTGEATHYPPGYPLVLRILDAIPGLGLHTAILLLNIACVVALTVALARIVVHLTGPGPRQILASAVAASFVCGPRVIDYTTAPLTETVFYAAWAWSLVLLLENRHRRPAGMAALVGLGLVALSHRYIAASLVIGIALWILLADGRGRTALRRAGLYLAAVATPLVLWAQIMGGVAQDRAVGELAPTAAFRDSLRMFGAVLTHLQTGRLGGVTGPAYVLGPGGRDDLVERLTLLLAVAVIALAGVTLYRVTDRFRRLPITEAIVLIAVTTLVHVVHPLIFRIRIRHIFLDRYWGLAPSLLLLIAAVRPASPNPTAAERRFDQVTTAFIWAITAFAVLWSAHRYGADLPAIRDTIKRV